MLSPANHYQHESKSDGYNSLSPKVGNYPRQHDPNRRSSTPTPTHVVLLVPLNPMYQGKPTVIVPQTLDSVADIKALHEALNGWCCWFGASSEGLARVLCHRSNDQLQVMHIHERQAKIVLGILLSKKKLIARNLLNQITQIYRVGYSLLKKSLSLFT